MKKQLRLIGIALVMILAIMQFTTTSYGTSIETGGMVGPSIEIDTTPPNIISVSADKTMVKPGESITFNMEVEDDSSGAKTFFVYWVFKQDPTQTLHQQYDIMYDIGGYVYGLSDSMEAGDWEAMQVGIYDNQDNFQIYQRETSEIVAKFDFSVEDIGQDVRPPVVSNVKRITNTVTAPGQVIIQYDVTDDRSGVNEFAGGFNYSPVADLHDSRGAHTEKIGENTYQATVNVESPHDKFVFQYIQVADQAGNWKNYTYEDLGLTNNELDITPTNYVEDNTAPKLLSVEYNTTELYIPDYLEITINAEDTEAGFDTWMGSIWVQSDDGTYEVQNSINKEWDSDKGTVRLEFGEGSVFRGKIYVNAIELKDKIGNKKIYSLENGDFEKKEIEVKKIEKTYTLVTRTSKTNYIDEIASLPDGSTVLCDVLQKKPIIKKELFDAIKGKDITVTFMSLYDGNGQIISTDGEISSADSNMGIQWIINGKDIVNETKDIDMIMKIKEKQYSKYILPAYKLNEMLEEEFWSNVDFDTMTDELHEEKMEECKILQKQEITRYFDSLKKDGYVGVDEVYEEALALIEEGMGYWCRDAILEAGGYTDYISIEFADNGLLPCKTLIRIKPEYAMRALIGAKDLKVYFVEGDKYSLIEDNIDLDLEKYYNFTVTHNSEYVLTSSEFEKLAKVENNVPGGEGDMGQPDDTNKDDANKDDTNKDDTNKDDANKDDANKDDANKDDANKDDTNKDNATTNNNNKLDKTPNTGNIEIISIISLIAVISLAGIIVLKKK